jgi:hypothetical protein
VIRYADVATMDTTWAVKLTPLIPTTLSTVRTMMELASHSAPLTAYASGSEDEVYSVILARDPSRTHGTPRAEDCDRAVREIAAISRWTATPRTTGAMVAMGLREGYAPDAHVWTIGDVRAACPGVPASPVHLLSARRIGGEVQGWEEPCVLLTPTVIDIELLDHLASGMCQERYTVTDWTAGRTYTRTRTRGASMGTRLSCWRADNGDASHCSSYPCCASTKES